MICLLSVLVKVLGSDTLVGANDEQDEGLWTWSDKSTWWSAIPWVPGK